jgi:hypothetical protein
MRRFNMKVPGRSQLYDFDEIQVRECDDFCDPERDEVLALNIGDSARLDDGSVVTRVE